MTPEEIEFRRKMLLDSLEGEDPITTRLAEAVPEDKLDWRPAPDRCFSTAELIKHTAGAAMFFVSCVDGTEPEAADVDLTSKSSLLGFLDDCQRRFRARVTEYTTEELGKEIDAFGMKMSAVSLLWWHPWHTVHHRGQLSTYLRAMGAVVPSTYGPSGDTPAERP